MNLIPHSGRLPHVGENLGAIHLFHWCNGDTEHKMGLYELATSLLGICLLFLY